MDRERISLLREVFAGNNKTLASNSSSMLCKTPTCLGDVQIAALEALLLRHVRLFSDAVADINFNVHHIYIHQKDERFNHRKLIEIAIDLYTPSQDFFILQLVKSGASLDDVNPVDETSPLHQICKKGDTELLEKLLNCVGSSVNWNVQDGEGMTPCHVILEEYQTADENNKRSHIRNLEILLFNVVDLDPNVEDLRGNLTPLYYAASSGSIDAVKLLLSHGANPDKEIDGNRIRDIIVENISNFDVDAYSRDIKIRPIKSLVFECIERNDINALKRISVDISTYNDDNGSVTLLQMAVILGHEQIVKYLLEEGADPNGICKGQTKSPILLAAHYGYYKILNTFQESLPRSNFTQIDELSGKSVLHEVLSNNSCKYITKERQESSIIECLNVLLNNTSSALNSQMNQILNYRDYVDGNTALHLATMQSNQNIIKLLLKRGANMGIKNRRGKTPVESILPSTLKSFLDNECLSWNGIITDENFKLTYHYDFLAPPLLKPEFQEQDTQPLPETEPLWYLSMASKEHRRLLKHPVVASFLWMKWQRIRSYFYINLFLYLCFVTFVTGYIFVTFGGSQLQMEGSLPFNSANSNLRDGLSIVIGILLLVLGLREIFQMTVSFKRYFLSLENLLELAIIVLTAIIAFDRNDEINIEMNRHLAGLVILFTWTELLILIGRHPRLTTNIVMFTTVIRTFLIFLTWYGLIIIAFALSFYIMMHTDHSRGNQTREESFFNSPSLSLVKTSAMFVGELEFESIPFTNNIISYLVFVAFIFLIVVVLMNLLNGLAVSDTSLIREEAKVLGWMSRVELITYTESMLLGDPFYFLSNWPPLQILKKLPSCALCRILYKIPGIRDGLQKITGGTQILLFYSCLPNKTASFYPNKKDSNLSYKAGVVVEDNEISKSSRLYVSADVLDSTKDLILEQMRLMEEENILDKQFKMFSNKIDEMENIMIRFLSTS